MPQSWESYVRQEEKAHENAAMGRKLSRCLSAILADHSADNLGQLADYLYKYTDCGAALGVLLHRGDDEGQWMYGNLHNLDMSKEIITALSISSIVEGVDVGTNEIIVDLTKMRGPKTAVKAYNAAIAETEREASAIWSATHGCPRCAEHFGHSGEHGSCDGDDGMTPVWAECPDCQGMGSII